MNGDRLESNSGAEDRGSIDENVTDANTGIVGSERRTFLRAVASFGAVAALPNVARAGSKPGFHRIIDRSLRVREATNSIDRWYDYLRRRGIDGDGVTHRYVLPRKASGDVGTDHWYRDELDVTISIFSGGCDDDDYYVDLAWRYSNDTDDSHVGGELPVDVAGLFWDPNWWDLTSRDIDRSLRSSAYVSYRDGSFDGDGPAFDVDDLSIYANEDESDVWYCGAFLLPLGDYSPSERRVYGEYCHTWNSIEITGVGVSYPKGISVSVSDTDHRWYTDTEQDGRTLLYVAQSDATRTCM